MIAEVSKKKKCLPCKLDFKDDPLTEINKYDWDLI